MERNECSIAVVRSEMEKKKRIKKENRLKFQILVVYSLVSLLINFWSWTDF